MKQKLDNQVTVSNHVLNKLNNMLAAQPHYFNPRNALHLPLQDLKRNARVAPFVLGPDKRWNPHRERFPVTCFDQLRVHAQ